jgi:FkbM family methyltransferase
LENAAAKDVVPCERKFRYIVEALLWKSVRQTVKIIGFLCPIMSWKEPWYLKIRRRFRKPFNKIFHRQRYFISRYLGADFLLQPRGIGTLEISAKISERPELNYLIARCAEFDPELFIDIGANIGMYSCILLRNQCAPRAILFEPDRCNLIRLRANLLMNGLLDLCEVREAAVGDVPGARRLVPGEVDGGFSRIADAGDDAGSGYEVPVTTLDDVFRFSNRRLAIKIDVEDYECNVLSGMKRTLRDNRCIIQVETFKYLDRVRSLLATEGYQMQADFSPNFVFSNANFAPISKEDH